MKPLRGALFDLGSNSIKFMMGEQKGSTLTVYTEKTFVTRLAEKMAVTGQVSPQAMARSLAVLKDCCREAKVFGATRITAVGTSALRSAENRRDFIQRVRKETGLTVRVISGKKEGELVFTGICSSKRWARKPILAVDIGGGSVEFVSGQAGKISFTRSLPLGCVRVRDQFLKSQPVQWKVLETTSEILQGKVAPVLKREGKGHTLVASGGTASALAWLQFTPEERPPLDALEGFAIGLEALDKVIKDLSRLRPLQIEKEYHLPAGRADIVVSGAVILRSILLQSGNSEALFASRGLRYGLWQQEIAPQLFRHVKWQHLS